MLIKSTVFIAIILLAVFDVGLGTLAAQNVAEEEAIKNLTSTTTTSVLPFPLSFSFYSAPQKDSSVSGAVLSYKWDELSSSAIKFRQETVRGDYELADVVDSLLVSYEESTRLDLLIIEWGWPNLGLSLGAMWSNSFKWEKGFFQEIALDPIFSFEEISDFNLITPRIGLSAKVGERAFKLDVSAFLSPIYLAIQDQSLSYSYDGAEETQIQNAVGPGFLGLDFALNVELFDLILLEGGFSRYVYTVEEYSFGSYADEGGFEDYYEVLETTYTRVLVSASASLLIPLAQGKLQIGGSFYYRAYTSSNELGNVEEPVFGFILGYKPGR